MTTSPPPFTTDSAADAARAPKRHSALPPSVRRIVVVGGGSAGWMTALILARSLIEQGVEITVVESPAVGIIGVGEGSTPWLRGFFDSLGIEESEWMPACHATYKCGITFDGWSTKPGFERYFHPFASMLDNLTMTQFVHNADARVNGADVHAHSGPLLHRRAARRQASCAEAGRTLPVRYLAWLSLRFRACWGSSCTKRRSSAACATQPAHVTHATLDEHGAIASVGTREGRRSAATCSSIARALRDC